MAVAIVNFSSFYFIRDEEATFSIAKIKFVKLGRLGMKERKDLARNH